MKEGWKEVKFSNIFNYPKKAIISGPFGSNLKASEYQNEGVPLVRLQNVDRWKFINQNIKYITYEKSIELSSHAYKSGDILITKLGVPLGKACIAPPETGEGIIMADIVRVRLENDSIDKKFIVYQLNSGTIAEQLKLLTTGATRPRVTLKNIRDLNLILPPLSEQKQIVAILDKAFAAIDKAKANIERNIENAKELFQSKLNEIFSQKGEGWEEKPIGELSEIVTKGSSPKWQGVNYVNDAGILFITSENVGEGKLLMKKRKYLEDRFNELQKRSILEKGDVLTNIVGASIGRTALYDLDETANINQAVCLIRCKDSLLLNYYLMHLLNSPFFKNILHDNEVNNARANLSLTFFKNLVIPVPEVLEQRSIVEEIISMRDKVNFLLNNLERKLINVDDLKKSFLQKAFTGELTEKDILV